MDRIDNVYLRPLQLATSAIHGNRIKSTSTNIIIFVLRISNCVKEILSFSMTVLCKQIEIPSSTIDDVGLSALLRSLRTPRFIILKNWMTLLCLERQLEIE